MTCLLFQDAFWNSCKDDLMVNKMALSIIQHHQPEMVYLSGNHWSLPGFLILLLTPSWLSQANIKQVYIFFYKTKQVITKPILIFWSWFLDFVAWNMGPSMGWANTKPPGWILPGKSVTDTWSSWMRYRNRWTLPVGSLWCKLSRSMSKGQCLKVSVQRSMQRYWFITERYLTTRNNWTTLRTEIPWTQSWPIPQKQKSNVGCDFRTTMIHSITVTRYCISDSNSLSYSFEQQVSMSYIHQPWTNVHRILNNGNQQEIISHVYLIKHNMSSNKKTDSNIFEASRSVQ